MQRWIFGFGAIWAEISDWGEKQESMRRTQREGIKEAVRSTSDIKSRVLCLAERNTIKEPKQKKTNTPYAFLIFPFLVFFNLTENTSHLG